MKKTILILSILSLTGCATYNGQPVIDGGAVVGGVAGGLLGSMVGGGTGKTIATATGAVIGAQIGSQASRPYAPFPTQSRGVPPAPPYPYNNGNPIYERSAPCDGEQYVDGNYNPPAARARCMGRMERERQLQREYERESYERGRRGQ